uniref:Putative secreted protein n=1 Tax=Ixodes ricinus TaxID=34613 RepID=A0A6B0U8L3_IXORI
MRAWEFHLFLCIGIFCVFMTTTCTVYDNKNKYVRPLGCQCPLKAATRCSSIIPFLLKADLQNLCLSGKKRAPSFLFSSPYRSGFLSYPRIEEQGFTLSSKERKN